ncbi:hypothetical protein VU00_10045, partial [Candidatus Electrothrix marina]
MSLIGWLITQAGATFHKYRYDKKRAELLASIREKYPDCTFSDKCKIHQSIFGSQVTILPGAIVKKSRIEDYVVLHAGVRVVAATIGCYT